MAAVDVFDMLQVRPLLGRTFEAGDATNPDVVVLSFDTWRLHYHSDPAIVGKALEFRTGALLAPIPPRLLTVIGVLRSDFEYPTGPLDFFTPFALDPKRTFQVTTIARLAAGVSLQAATEEANTMGSAMRPPWPAASVAPTGPRFEIQSLKERAVEPLRPALRILLAAVGVVLLIVCANVANLMLARGMAKQREVAVRLAIGASRVQIIREVLIESVTLAMAGGAFGAILGAVGVTLVQQLASVEAPGIFRLMFGSTILPRGNEIVVSWRLLTIALSISAVACIVFGSLPALQLSRADQLHAAGSRRSDSSGGTCRMRSALVIAQLTLATILLVGAGLLTHSVMRLASFNKGYNPSNVLAFNLLFPDQYSSARKGETIETLLSRLRAKPGVRAAGFARHGLLIGEELYIGQWVPPGQTFEEMKNERFRVRSVSDGFLTAMGVPIIGGRELLPSDNAAAPPVVVINQSAARKYFTGNPVGQVVDWHLAKSVFQVTVAGVVADVHQRSATDQIVPEMFVDYRQHMKAEAIVSPELAERRQNEAAIGFLSFALRTSDAPSLHVTAVRDAINAIDPNIGIDAIAPMTELEASSIARERFYAVMLGIFAGVSALLAAIGIYGVLAYAVTQRTKEIGVRMALGAARRQVITLVLGRGLMLTLTGISLGLIAAVALSRYLQSMLFGIQPTDATTFIAVAIAFSATAIAACYLPARRATTIDPVIALRHD
jgi:putative ABC transport system permease protein